MNKEYQENCDGGLVMKDKDYLATMLELEKNMSNNYSIAMNEASTDDLYEEFFDMFTSIKDSARDIFDLMNHYGYYTLKNVEEEKVTKKIQELNKKLDQLECE